MIRLAGSQLCMVAKNGISVNGSGGVSWSLSLTGCKRYSGDILQRKGSNTLRLHHHSIVRDSRSAALIPGQGKFRALLQSMMKSCRLQLQQLQAIRCFVKPVFIPEIALLATATRQHHTPSIISTLCSGLFFWSFCVWRKMS